MKQLTFDDCAPDWPEPVDQQPDDHTPARFDQRQQEMRDLRDQGAGPVALWTAHTIDVGRYL